MPLNRTIPTTVPQTQPPSGSSRSDAHRVPADFVRGEVTPTHLQLPYDNNRIKDTTITSVSDDPALADASSTAIVTERAVKDYVDTGIGGVTHHGLPDLNSNDDHDELYPRIVGRDGFLATYAALIAAFPAAAGYRGWWAVVVGAAGARDRYYVCMKSDSNTYAWVEVANGGL